MNEVRDVCNTPRASTRLTVDKSLPLRGVRVKPVPCVEKPVIPTRTGQRTNKIRVPAQSRSANLPKKLPGESAGGRVRQPGQLLVKDKKNSKIAKGVVAGKFYMAAARGEKTPTVQSPVTDQSLSTRATEKVWVDNEEWHIDPIRKQYPNDFLEFWDGTQKDVEKLQYVDYRVMSDNEAENTIRANNKAAKLHQASQAKAYNCRNYASYDPSEELLSASHLPKACDFKSGCFESDVYGGWASAKGDRTYMENAHLAALCTVTIGNNKVPLLLAGVFDGHGGDEASAFVKQNIIKTLKSRLKQHNTDKLTASGIYNALTSTMADLDRGITRAGTTACVCIVIDGELWTASVGDSRALLIYEGGDCCQLSEDACSTNLLDVDKINARGLLISDWFRLGTDLYDLPLDPTLYPEVFRDGAEDVIRRGGEFIIDMSYGDLKVSKVRHRANNGCALSLLGTLGDHMNGGVHSPRPKITRYPIDDSMERVVICSNGVFKRISSDQLSKMIQIQSEKNRNITDKEVAETIISHAYQSGSDGDMTAVVLSLVA